MHTSSGVDDIDEFAETIVQKGGKLFYRYGAEERPVHDADDRRAVQDRRRDGDAETSRSTARITARSCARPDGKWIGVGLMQEPLKALTQSYRRTKAKNLADFRRRWSCTPTRRTTRSTPTPTATSPTSTPTSSRSATRRFDWTKPVDGSDPATDWQGLHAVDETPDRAEPGRTAGSTTPTTGRTRRPAEQPEEGGLPGLLGRGGENPRGVHAIRVLDEPEGLHARLADRRGLRPLPARVRRQIPPLLEGLGPAPGVRPAEGQARRADRGAARLGLPLGRGFGADHARRVLGRGALGARVGADARGRASVHLRLHGPPAHAAAALDALVGGRRPLTADFGTGRRRGATSTASSASPATSCSRSTTRAEHPGAASRPPAGARSPRSARAPTRARRSATAPAATASWPWWSSATACGARAVTAGGESGDPASKHFNDQAERYATGDLREVYFYPADLERRAERTDRPGPTPPPPHRPPR